VQQVVANDALVLFLKDREIPCPVCGYNLRGLRTPACPECGSELTLQIAGAAPHMIVVLSAMAPLFLFIGIAVLFLLIAATSGLPDGWGFYLIQAGAAVDCYALWCLYRLRLRLQRLRHKWIIPCLAGR